MNIITSLSSRAMQNIKADSSRVAISFGLCCVINSCTAVIFYAYRQSSHSQENASVKAWERPVAYSALILATLTTVHFVARTIFW